MINAEEMGVTQKNVDEMAKSDKPDLNAPLASTVISANSSA